MLRRQRMTGTPANYVNRPERASRARPASRALWTASRENDSTQDSNDFSTGNVELAHQGDLSSGDGLVGDSYLHALTFCHKRA
jgi:hypothetical protein